MAEPLTMPASRPIRRPADSNCMALRSTATGPSAAISKVTAATSAKTSDMVRRRHIACDLVDRHDAVGKAAAEARDRADREQLGRDVERELGIIVIADSSAAQDRRGMCPRQRGDALRTPPQERQHRRHHAGARHRQIRDHAVGVVRQLDRDRAAFGNADLAQQSRQRADPAVGLCIGETAWRAAGHGFAVRRIISATPSGSRATLARNSAFRAASSYVPGLCRHPSCAHGAPGFRHQASGK